MSKKVKETSKVGTVNLGFVPEYTVTYSREEKLWGVHINGTSTYILKRPVNKKNMYYVGTRYFKTLRDAIFSVVIGSTMPFYGVCMNQELIIILSSILDKHLCFKFEDVNCDGVSCRNCLLINHNDNYVYQLIQFGGRII